MNSSSDFEHRACLHPSPTYCDAAHGTITLVTRHAITQCMDRADISRPSAIARILGIAREGNAWTAPHGEAVRRDNEVIGVAPNHWHKHGLAVTTYYKIDQPVALNAYAAEVKARNQLLRPQTRKPGRHKAWERLKRQGKHCRRPPSPAEDPAES